MTLWSSESRSGVAGSSMFSQGTSMYFVLPREDVHRSDSSTSWSNVRSHAVWCEVQNMKPVHIYTTVGTEVIIYQPTSLAAKIVLGCARSTLTRA